MKDSHPLLAREGWIHIAIAVAIAAGLGFVHVWLLAPAAVLVLFVVQFFRDPHRQIPPGEGLVVSPADGRVIQVGPADDPCLDRRALRISVFMNVFNVHSNRMPVAGEIVYESYRPGRFVNAALDKASAENEANHLAVRSAQGDVAVVQIAGLIARRIMCYVHKGDTVARGQRYGFIRFGSRVDVYLPEGCQPAVAIGDKVAAGEDVLAQLPPLDE